MICDKCKRPIMQDRVYFRVEVRTENQEHPFVGEYFFHTECWDDVWQNFATYREKIYEQKSLAGCDRR